MQHRSSTRQPLWDEPVIGMLSREDPKQVLYPMSKLADLAGTKSAQDLWGESLDWEAVDLERLSREMDRLPAFEADLIELTLLGCHQEDLAAIFGCSQANISYRIRHGLETLRWLASLPEITEEQIRLDLDPWLNPGRVETLVLFARYRNMSLVARKQDRTPGSTRHSILTSLDILAGEHREDCGRYADYFRQLCTRVQHYSQDARRSDAERLASPVTQVVA